MAFSESDPGREDVVAGTARFSFWSVWSDYQVSLVLGGLLSGIAAGILLGEYCAPLSLVGDAFVGLLRMTVLPFIAITLIANLGRLPLRQTRHLAVAAVAVLVTLWSLTFLVIWFLPFTLPAIDSGSLFSSVTMDPATKVDVLSVFIPSNIFTALANNHVPAIIFFCICMGAALATVPNRGAFIATLDVASSALLRIAGFIAKLAPVGVFAIAASTAGTMTLDEAGRLQAYLILYGFGSALIGLVIFPLLITSLTPLTYRQFWQITRGPMITAFATGKLIIVLPMLIENTEKLFAKTRQLSGQGKQEVELLYTAAYAFPHAGKLLSMLFIPFVSWFFGDRMHVWEFPAFYLSGLAAFFGGPLVAIPYLLDEMELPHDMFQLFLLAGVLGERVGDAIGVVHLAAFVLLTLMVLSGSLRQLPLAAIQFLGASLLSLLLFAFVANLVLSRSVGWIESKSQWIAQMQLIESPVDSVVILDGEPNPVPRQAGESVIDRVRRRGVLRIGFNEDKLPFAFFNLQKNLVGFDINLAHALARDLGVTLEFVRFDRATLVEQIRADHFDLVMSGLVGTLERSEAMQHSNSYMDVTLGLVVPDHRVGEFESLDAIRDQEDLRIGFVDLSRGFVARLRQALPDAQLVEIRNNRDYFEDPELSLDALLISAESGSAFSLMYPKHEVAVPRDLEVKLPLFYAIQGTDGGATRNLVNHWIELRQKDGTFREYYEHWIQGKSRQLKQPRWSVIRDVLHWVD